MNRLLGFLFLSILVIVGCKDDRKNSENNTNVDQGIKDSVVILDNTKDNSEGNDILNGVTNVGGADSIKNAKSGTPQNGANTGNSSNKNSLEIDRDNDGYSNLKDCDDNNPLITIPGQPCDDKNFETTKDTLNNDCQCIGVKREAFEVWYSDLDNDGFGDPMDSINSVNKPNSGSWVKNNTDYCPDRSGEDKGCPIIELQQLNIADKRSIDQDFKLPLSQNDRIYWYSKDDLIAIVNENYISPSIKANDFGLYNLSANISFGDYEVIKHTKICSYMSKEYIKSLLENDIIRIGQYNRGDPIPQLERNRSENSRSVIVSHSSNNILISENNKVFGNDIGAFIDAKMLTKGSFVKNVRINELETDFNTCQIKKIDLSLEK